MLPIFNDYCTFIYDKCGLKITEGLYWMDRMIIKAFDKQGNIHKVHRLKIENDLSMTYTTYKTKEFRIATWNDTILLFNERLNELEHSSISLLQKYGLNTKRMIIDTNSTGKDSEVKTYLARKAGLIFDTYFNCTTMDVADSNRFAKQKGYKFTYPEKKYGGFYQHQKKENIIPNRLNRYCCQYFKENATKYEFSEDEKILFLFGMRNDESNARSGYQDEWINDKWGNRDWLGLLPIRHWTDLDIWLYTLREEIDINTKYKKGYDRVGCGIVCPNYTKSTWILDKYWYPPLFKRWRNILKDDFINNNKWLIMNCTIEEYITQAWNGGVFRSEPTEEVIQEYATYNEMDLDVAKKYFNRYCTNGCLNKRRMPMKIKDKATLGMNMKLFGRQIDKFKCKKCLMKEFSWTKEDWDAKVEEFKEQGCKLF